MLIKKSRWQAHKWIGCVLLILGGLFFCNTVMPATTALEIETGVTELLVKVEINQQEIDEAVMVLKQNNGLLFVSLDDLQRWRFRTPETPPIRHRNSAFYALKEIPGLVYVLDERQLTLSMTAPPQAFLPSQLDIMENQPVSAIKPG